MITFQELGLIEPLTRALAAEGYTHPTPIQAQAIPLALKGHDILGTAQTGTGKTAAFTLPILQLMVAEKPAAGKRVVKTLILTPTRELAIQIGESISTYAANTSLRHAVIFGGVSQKAQTDALARGVDILVATPGRLLDLINQGFIHLKSVSFLVLDEADRMLDMGFIHDVKRIIQLVPKKRQTLFFSATMPPAIQTLADVMLQAPKSVEVSPVSSTAETIQQALFYVDKKNKKNLLQHLLENKEMDRVLVFTKTKHGANKVVQDLEKAHIKAEAIHGNKSQNARQNALSNFKNYKTRVLVATDIAARGIDVDDLAFVINYELPNVPETYVHRIGRTGRAGSKGKAISFCEEEERPFLKDIEKLIGLRLPVEENNPFPPVKEVPSSSEVKQQVKSQRSGGRGRSGKKPWRGGNGNANRPKRQS
ncbi:DEAD/DEAH box helicase [Shiella aurantiaca]|uniref:DEAD/DEAH box helicase n=1 Tax=Shiella aurantiaca TaxID=3058365 RepID=UPI003872D776